MKQIFEMLKEDGVYFVAFAAILTAVIAAVTYFFPIIDGATL
jgi:hypothetical protein